VRNTICLVAALLTPLVGCNAPPNGTGHPSNDGAASNPFGLDGGVPTGDGGSEDLPPGQWFPPRPSPIAAENQKPGSSGWRLTLPSTGLNAYADAIGVAPGATVSVHAAATSADTATWELWRLGYYGGARGRLITSGGPVAIPAATPAIMDPSTGMVTAGWPATFDVAVPGDAPTGYYLIKLSTAQAQTYAPLVVREAEAGAPILIDIATDTYQAYNAWGGTSLYDNRRSDWHQQHAYAVSFDRPYEQGNGAGQLFYSDRDLITFVEAQGYDVGFVTDEDLDRDVQLLARRRLAVVQGHSEYWTANQRNHVEAALSAGTNLAFFGANNVYWQVRWAPDRRTLIGYKEYCALDPLMATAPDAASCRYRDLTTPRPENALVGVMFGEWQMTAAPFRIADASAWLWTGTGASSGDLIPGLFGYESDRRYENGAEPSGLVELGSTIIENHSAEVSVAQAAMYTAPSGATVFAAASTDWSRLLGSDGMWDARVQQATANLFSKLGGDGTLGTAALTPYSLGPAPAPPNYRGGVTVSTVTAALTQPLAVIAASNGDALVADGNRIVRVTPAGALTVVAGSTASGYADGPAASAQFFAPHGLALRSDSGLYVSDSNNHRIRLVLDGAVSTVAGGNEGFADGTGTAARFDTPEGIALDPSGTLVVADTWNRRIRAVDTTGKVTTWAGDGTVWVKDGPGAQAQFNFPFALAMRADGSTIVVDDETGLLRLVGADAAHTVSTYAGENGRPGWFDGATASAGVMEIQALAQRPSGETVLVDGATWRLRGMRGNGYIDTIAGGATAALTDGAGASAGFQMPHGVAAAPDGSLLVADTGNHALRRIVCP
jgi:sugar lactone lactonase YvrE